MTSGPHGYELRDGTLQKDRVSVWVRRVVPNVANAAVTVYLNMAAGQSTRVAWFVLS